MKESYNYMTCDEAIAKLQEMKKKNRNQKVLICSIDFDNDKSSRKVEDYDAGYVLVRKSKTVIFNEDVYVPHIQCYSKKQDIENILREGTVHDIIFGG